MLTIPPLNWSLNAPAEHCLFQPVCCSAFVSCTQNLSLTDILTDVDDSNNPINVSDPTDTDGLLEDIEVMEIDEPSCPRHEQCTRDVDHFFSPSYIKDDGKKYRDCRICRYATSSCHHLTSVLTTPQQEV